MHKLSSSIIFSLALLFIFSLTIYAQSDERKFEAAGQLRLRAENENKDFNTDTDAIDFTLMRTRLNLKFTYSDKLIVFAQLQDSRTFGEEGQEGATGTLTSIRNVDLHQGYFQINRLFFPWLNYKFGRMELAYGAQRLIGVNSWSNIGRAFNGSVMTLNFKTFQIDFIESTLAESFQAPDSLNGDQTLSGIWVKIHRPNSPLFHIYLLSDEDKQQNAKRDSKFKRSTIGARIEDTWEQFNLEAEANFQTGKMDFIRDIFAFYLSGGLSFDFGANAKNQLFFGADYLSGDKASTSKYECFNTLYPAKHKFFGYMDYFTDIPKHTRNLGLTDIMAKGKFSPFEKISLGGDFHYFRLSQSALVKDGSASKELGAEFDFTFSFDYMKNLNFTAGSSIFMPGKVFKDWKGADPSFWFYGQTTVNF
ncbi:MAG: alginate export family protein [candidate division KSB1 bacterium]|nr:alginate export family protein [candidate division KSB1 bacterium]MDZ7336209.1 alginate export family protein [candidate division KSB1 bacterium]MDZ7358958.1 alginate export family protein [candidate division KSB1 bacterium]MDZ7376360.1 alginate export family protein [candidate division KSB1 bacterium]MDZ7402343.1 alginate export family protein [candidate division KSB1 bacterium]